MISSVLLLLGSFAGLAAAQFPPKPEGVKVIKSKFHENVTISFKEVSDGVALQLLFEDPSFSMS